MNVLCRWMVMKLTKTDFITLHVAAIIVLILSIVIEKSLHCKKLTCPRSPTFDKPNTYTNQSSQTVPTPHGSPLAGRFWAQASVWSSGGQESRLLQQFLEGRSSGQLQHETWLTGPPGGGGRASPNWECFALRLVFVTPRLICAHPSLPRFRAVFPLTPLWCFPRPTAWRCFCVMKMRESMWTHTAESLKTWCSSGERCPPLLVGFGCLFHTKRSCSPSRALMRSVREHPTVPGTPENLNRSSHTNTHVFVYSLFFCLSCPSLN